MQDSHLQAIMAVTDSRDRVRDPGLRGLLGDMVTGLRHHEQMATNLVGVTVPPPSR